MQRHSLTNILGIPLRTEIIFDETRKGIGYEADIEKMPIVNPYEELIAPGDEFPNFMVDYSAVDGNDPIR